MVPQSFGRVYISFPNDVMEPSFDVGPLVQPRRPSSFLPEAHSYHHIIQAVVHKGHYTVDTIQHMPYKVMKERRERERERET